MKAINDDYLSSSITINDMMVIDGASFEAAKDIGNYFKAATLG